MRNTCFRCLAPRGETAPVASRRLQRETKLLEEHRNVLRRSSPRTDVRLHLALALLRHQLRSGLCHPACPAGGSDTQAVLKTLRGLGLSEDLLVQVAKSLQPPSTKKVSSRERQMTHVKEQLHNFRGRIEKQTESVRKRTEQYQLMVAKLDGLKREETGKEAQYRELCSKKFPGDLPPLTFLLPPSPLPIEGSPLLNTDSEAQFLNLLLVFPKSTRL